MNVCGCQSCHARRITQSSPKITHFLRWNSGRTKFVFTSAQWANAGASIVSDGARHFAGTVLGVWVVWLAVGALPDVFRQGSRNKLAHANALSRLCLLNAHTNDGCTPLGKNALKQRSNERQERNNRSSLVIVQRRGTLYLLAGVTTVPPACPAEPARRESAAPL